MSSVGRSFAWALAVVAVAAVPRAARADDADAQSEEYIQRGIVLRRLGDNRRALDAFQRAYGLSPSPRAAAQVALAHQALGEWVDAERGLDEALRAPDDPWIVQYMDALESALATVHAHLGWLRIGADPSQAELVIDGSATFELPAPEAIRVVAGTLELDVRAPGRLAAHRTVDVPAAARVEVFVTLEPQAATFNPTPHPEPPGSQPSSPPDSTRRGTPATAYVAFGAAGLFAVGGIVAWRIREDNVAIYNDDRRCLVGAETRAQQCGDRARTADTALGFEIGSFALAAASAGFALWRSWGPSVASSTVSTLPCAPWAGLGVACRGRF